jgi:hypothetical protein
VERVPELVDPLGKIVVAAAHLVGPEGDDLPQREPTRRGRRERRLSNPATGVAPTAPRGTTGESRRAPRAARSSPRRSVGPPSHDSTSRNGRRGSISPQQAPPRCRPTVHGGMDSRPLAPDNANRLTRLGECGDHVPAIWDIARFEGNTGAVGVAALTPEVPPGAARRPLLSEPACGLTPVGPADRPDRTHPRARSSTTSARRVVVRVDDRLGAGERIELGLLFGPRADPDRRPRVEPVTRPWAQLHLDAAVLFELAVERPPTLAVLVGLLLQLHDEPAFRVRLKRLHEEDVSRGHPVLAQDPVGLVPVVHQRSVNVVLSHRQRQSAGL